MKISAHYDLDEFGCYSDPQAPYPAPWVEGRLLPLVEDLEKIRAVWGHPITITSGYRTPQVNAAVGGVGGSQHLEGQAVDFIVQGIPVLAVWGAVEALVSAGLLGQNCGLGLYHSHVHYDRRDARARWTSSRD